MDDRYASLTPPQIVAALRSMPRRFTEALESAAPRTPDQVMAHVAADLGAMLAHLDVLDDAIHVTADHAADPLPAAVDAAARNAERADHATGAVPSAALTLADIELTTGRLADRLDRLSADDWNRVGQSPTMAYRVTDLAQGAVRVAAERLRVTERAIDALGVERPDEND